MFKIAGILDCQKGINNGLRYLIIGNIFTTDTAEFTGFCGTVICIDRAWLLIHNTIGCIIAKYIGDDVGKHKKTGNTNKQRACDQDNQYFLEQTALLLSFFLGLGFGHICFFYRHVISSFVIFWFFYSLMHFAYDFYIDYEIVCIL